MRRAVLVGILIAGCPWGCSDDPDKTAACNLGEVTSAATVQDRKIIGVAAPYVPDAALAAREAELEGSIAARRAAAWQVVERVLDPVPLAEPRLADNFGSQPSVPAWHTWYARDDFERVFKKLYRDLGPEGRRARAPIDVAGGFAWNAVALDGMPEWPEQRYLDYLATIDTAEEASGVGNAARVGYSPGALGHLLDSYVKLHQCRLDATPDPYATDPVREGQLVVETEAMEVGACDWQLLGPFQAGTAKVTVTMRGTGDADLYVRRGLAPDPHTFDCRARGGDSNERCTIDGGGPVYVAVFGADAGAVDVSIEYLQADVIAPTCLGTAMPRDGVLVKADWRRHLQGELLPIFDTSGARMASRLRGEATWNSDGVADPQPSAMYTVTLPSSGQRFRMAALHIMSKELDHWMWITLWWSPTPDTDFGADRPASIAALPGPWANYKMCVATSYTERDPDPRGGRPGSLGDALAAVHGGVGAPSWCSNPYLEQGPHNAGTNCIGCHQHGGTELQPQAILDELPHQGSTRVRNNFFTDYLWAVKGGNGDDLSAIIQAEVDYWDAND
ncbi:MAG: PPC domain-containing protein [Deltaproteobacteria bacterium]|nr:PPC domain-containing protein [Deltaproteobacteria bacterium]